MNERILKLAKQLNWEEVGADYIGTVSDICITTHELSKFAELIVRECCQKLENDGMVEVAMEMKEHFGVE